jgi:hypothetical protein
MFMTNPEAVNTKPKIKAPELLGKLARQAKADIERKQAEAAHKSALARENHLARRLKRKGETDKSRFRAFELTGNGRRAARRLIEFEDGVDLSRLRLTFTRCDEEEGEKSVDVSLRWLMPGQGTRFNGGEEIVTFRATEFPDTHPVVESGLMRLDGSPLSTEDEDYLFITTISSVFLDYGERVVT